MIDVVAAQARLDMGDGHLAIIGGEGCDHRGGGVALHDHPVGLLRIEHRAKGAEQPCGQPIERLAGGHDVQVDIGRDARELHHLVQHLAMLRRHHDAGVEAGMGP
jgi:hypothetical protein